MKKLSKMIHRISDDSESAKKAYRAAQVKKMWSACVEEIFLEHTNSVYIINENEGKTLIVYVDESIYAAELNARRELIKLKLLKEFNEDIRDFKILISRSSYKKNYPFKKDRQISNSLDINPQPLTEEEINKVNDVSLLVENENLRKSLKKAMISDWELKKGQNKNNK